MLLLPLKKKKKIALTFAMTAMLLSIHHLFLFSLWNKFLDKVAHISCLKLSLHTHTISLASILTRLCPKFYPEFLYYVCDFSSLILFDPSVDIWHSETPLLLSTCISSGISIHYTVWY